MNKKSISMLKYKRQYLFEPADEGEYDQLFRLMSPVPTQFWIEPGSPPHIQGRCDFDDGFTNEIRRRGRIILKGRFKGGNVGYVFKEEMPLFRAVYQREIKGYTEEDSLVLDILTKEGPMNKSLIKEISGLLSKEVSKSLSKLQKAFIVFEDQLDTDNDRGWYLLEDEFSDLDFNKIKPMEGLMEVIRRFAYLNVFISESMVKSYTRLPNKFIGEGIKQLMESGELSPLDLDGQEDERGYVLQKDIPLLNDMEDYEMTEAERKKFNKVYILDLNDYLVKSVEVDLKKAFEKSELKTLRYIFHKGEFIGRVQGYFRFGPDDVENVEQTPGSPEISDTLRNKIVTAVNENYSKEGGLLKRFMNEALN